MLGGAAQHQLGNTGLLAGEDQAAADVVDPAEAVSQCIAQRHTVGHCAAHTGQTVPQAGTGSGFDGQIQGCQQLHTAFCRNRQLLQQVSGVGCRQALDPRLCSGAQLLCVQSLVVQCDPCGGRIVRPDLAAVTVAEAVSGQPVKQRLLRHQRRGRSWAGTVLFGPIE